MSNDSTTPGYLSSVDGSATYDEELERQLIRWVRAVSGLPEKMVRPRWTPDQAAQPAQNVNWCGFGIVDFDDDDTPAFVQVDGDTSELRRHEVIETMASFYGPGGQRIAAQFRDGISVNQNNDMINALGMSLFDYSRITPFHELINNQWVRRYDVTIRLRRKVTRTYSIKSIVDGNVTITTGE